MSVAKILNSKGKNVITATRESTLADVANMLAANKIGALVVLHENKVCGIVSERDLIREIAENGPAVLEQAVSQCMTQSVISCSKSDTIDHVMGVMNKGRFRHIPVIEDEALLGIISIRDVIECKIEYAERDAEELKRYIAS